MSQAYNVYQSPIKCIFVRENKIMKMYTFHLKKRFHLTFYYLMQWHFTLFGVDLCKHNSAKQKTNYF